jgi:hypothetical protein
MRGSGSHYGGVNVISAPLFRGKEKGVELDFLPYWDFDPHLYLVDVAGENILGRSLTMSPIIRMTSGQPGRAITRCRVKSHKYIRAIV